MAYKVGNTTVITNNAALGSVDGNSLQLGNNPNISAGGDGYSVDFLVIGGGGGAQNNQFTKYGGAGAGGVLSGSAVVSNGQTVSITVGAGGSANAASGSDSAFGIYTAEGGSRGHTANPGGCAGGTTGSSVREPIISDIAYNGFTGTRGGSGHGYQQTEAGGGGGHAEPGNTDGGGQGGDGKAWFDGVTRGGGGAGNLGGGGGAGGGGNTGTAGQANTGGGAGSGWRQSSNSGGSGIVVVRYAGNSAVGSGGTVSTSGGYVYHTFNTSGNFTA